MTSKAPSPDHVRAETAAYIATLSGELALMARRHGLDALGYLLEMAKLEAENATRANDPGGRPS